jgi:hypothetical protein
VINLLCEHGLIIAFAEQKRPVLAEAIQEVAREFQLDVVDPIAPLSAGENDESQRLMEAFQTLATLMDKLRRPR